MKPSHRTSQDLSSSSTHSGSQRRWARLDQLKLEVLLL